VLFALWRSAYLDEQTNVDILALGGGAVLVLGAAAGNQINTLLCAWLLVGWLDEFVCEHVDAF
jgi:hypothetical protein